MKHKVALFFEVLAAYLDSEELKIGLLTHRSREIIFSYTE